MRAPALFAFFISNVYGCDCRIPTVQTAMTHSEVVFRGTITALRDSHNGSGISPALVRDTKKIVVFRVSRVWKGEVGQIFEMPTIEETTACFGFWPWLLKVGNDLLV